MPPLLNGRCTSLLRAPVSEMPYTVSSETLNSSIPYHAIPYLSNFNKGCLVTYIYMQFLNAKDTDIAPVLRRFRQW